MEGMNPVWLALAVLAILAMGAVVGWFLKRAVAAPAGAPSAEGAQIIERLRMTEAALKDEKALNERSKELELSLRDALESARGEQARLAERAGRVEGLDARIKELTAELKETAADTAQKTQSELSLSQRLRQVENQLVFTQKALEDSQGLSRQVSERKAALEEAVQRIPTLERELSTSQSLAGETATRLAELREASGRENGKLSAELTAEREAVTAFRSEVAELQALRAGLERQISTLSNELIETRTRAGADRESAERSLKAMLDARGDLTEQFKNLAAEILEEKATRFTALNQEGIGKLVSSLQSDIEKFRTKVDEVYVQEGKERSALGAELRNLLELNNTLSEDAKNLTLALKGSSRAQGEWGEMILERVLESAGLRKGVEYDVQVAETRPDGSRAQPDVVIHLPENREMVIDSKVSLVAYERHANAESDQEAAVGTAQLVESIRTHIRALSEKKYQDLYGVRSPDFVIAFVPIEPAFMLACRTDNSLLMDAWRLNVLLVSPSTLLFVLRTVAHLWRQEAQTRNAQEIARRGADLYDKFCGFVEDLQQVGTRLQQAQSAFLGAQNKLSLGKGNLVRQAEMLRDLGVKPGKTLPAQILESAALLEDLIDGKDSGSEPAEAEAGAEVDENGERDR